MKRETKGKQPPLWQLVIPRKEKCIADAMILIIFIALLVPSLLGPQKLAELNSAAGFHLDEWYSVFFIGWLLWSMLLLREMVDPVCAVLAMRKCKKRLQMLGLLEAAEQEFAACAAQQDAVIFGDRFLFGRHSGVVYAYEDIVWCYTSGQSFALLPVREVLMMGTLDGRQTPIESDGTGKRMKGTISNVMDQMFERRPDLLFGFAKSTQMSYRTLVSAEKKKQENR